MDVAGLMIAHPPNERVPAAPDPAHGLTPLGKSSGPPQFSEFLVSSLRLFVNQTIRHTLSKCHSTIRSRPVELPPSSPPRIVHTPMRLRQVDPSAISRKKESPATRSRTQLRHPELNVLGFGRTELRSVRSRCLGDQRQRFCLPFGNGNPRLSFTTALRCSRQLRPTLDSVEPYLIRGPRGRGSSRQSPEFYMFHQGGTRPRRPRQ